MTQTRKGSGSSYKYPFPVTTGINRDRMLKLVEQNWFLNRLPVTPEMDICIENLQKEVGGTVLEIPSGSTCLTWKTPQTWTVRKAELKRLNGDVIASFAAHPLYLWAHSIAFEGEISRLDLIENHIFSDPRRPDEFRYHYQNSFTYGVRDWGFSLPHSLVETLTDESYWVEIDADLDDSGSMKVLDVFLPGESPETIFLMAHTCHPAQVSDGISCIAIAIELFHQLSLLPSRRYSYRFIFGPEYFAGAAYLASVSKEIISNLSYGIFLDMLSNHEPIGFQHSLQGNSRMDKVVLNVLQSHTDHFVERPYRKLWGNDETFYNGAGFGVPTLGIGRTMHREYHYNTDNLENMNLYHMVESVWYLQRITEVFETDYIPELNYQGPLYLSQYDLYIDTNIYPKESSNIEKMQYLAGQNYSCFDIADTLKIDYFFVRDFFDQLFQHGLISKKPRLFQIQDQGSFSGDH